MQIAYKALSRRTDGLCSFNCYGSSNNSISQSCQPGELNKSILIYEENKIIVPKLKGTKLFILTDNNVTAIYADFGMELWQVIVDKIIPIKAKFIRTNFPLLEKNKVWSNGKLINQDLSGSIPVESNWALCNKLFLVKKVANIGY